MSEETTALKSSKDTSRGNYNSYTAHHGAQIMLIMTKQKLQFILIVEHNINKLPTNGIQHKINALSTNIFSHDQYYTDGRSIVGRA